MIGNSPCNITAMVAIVISLVCILILIAIFLIYYQHRELFVDDVNLASRRYRVILETPQDLPPIPTQPLPPPTTPTPTQPPPPPTPTPTPTQPPPTPTPTKPPPPIRYGFPSTEFTLIEKDTEMIVKQYNQNVVTNNGSTITFVTAQNPIYTGLYPGYFMLQDSTNTRLYLRHKDYQCYMHELGTPLYDFVWKAELQTDGSFVIRNPYGNHNYFLSKRDGRFTLQQNAIKFKFGVN